MKERPLVSMTVICYRAERFVREAIEGALAQTYSPLEIIISDDASSDRTFEIIQEAVADYDWPTLAQRGQLLGGEPVNIGSKAALRIANTNGQPLQVRLLRIDSFAAQGLGAGTAGHGLATARALMVHETAGAFGGLAIGLNGLATAVMVPLLVRLLGP